ncbi:MAG: hypothetical protein CL920_08050 [Deltaproteobacteria bacterium]|nr:hypothetical protein [Deltaproteobacteria bacterium]MBU48632.1 hypothetical protein [Deltaproteobacteria bacterium]
MSNDTIRILYMEDEVGHATLLRRKMQRLGYQVELAFDGDEGLRKAAATDFDIIITDHNMPKSDGMQVIQRLRTELESDASIIMVTGAGSEHTAVEAMRLGADDYVVKDTEGGYLELLPAHIQKLIEKRALGLEKQLAQRALLESEEKFRAMFEHAPFGMVLCEKSGHILQANEQFCRIFGCPEEELRKQGCVDFLLSLDGDRAFTKWLFEGGDLDPIEMVMCNYLEESIPVQVQGTVFSDANGSDRIWLFVEEIRMRKEMQERLMQSSKLEAIGELAANVAHEMNNPLAIISAKARLLLSTEKTNMSQKVERELGKIIGQCDRLSRLTRGLLDYARPSFGSKQRLDLRKPLEKALSIVSHHASVSGVVVELSHADKPLWVLANANELEQVFLNLQLNAIEAMPNGGQLTICEALVETEGEKEVVVSIEDNGEGIPTELLHRIFEPFFSTKEEGKGTGLGLSICFGLIRSHHGHIDVSSEEGKGTRFTVRIPYDGEGH